MGLKPRADKPIELTMQAHGAGFSREATIDLRSGHCAAKISSYETRQGKTQRVTRELTMTISAARLRRLRATATAILSAGNTHDREQFSQMGVSFSARSQQRTATADFEIDVGSSTTYDSSWRLVFQQVDKL